MICPSCKRTFERPRDAAGPHFGPFCSARCRAADLGNWLAGAYRIPGDADQDDLDESPRPPPDPDDPIN